ncbi:MAG: YcaQ family DNA glycosylase [Tessaracoccus sp.]|uniref:winged helix-turn-helix domain-containing protein n=1 Tax=Tessaracoccus sp. TaxID=1971211 RepID=UPI001ED218B2|nr:crosslink repair DNA glycosylase YcaQ family protein [Tessaracoccus sp.]MBK7821087.1 YcaQ family DNA glycosylase [Tessaracoccus sp.]
MAKRLTAAAARRIAVAAQGLAAPRPRVAGAAALNRAISRLGVLQIDSVNVFERAHYLPLLARVGPYDRADLDKLLHHDAGRGLGRYTEYLAHEAAVLPVADWPLWAWRRELPVRDGFREWAAERGTLIDEVLAEVAERGETRVRDLEHPANVSLGGGWWNRNDVRIAADWLFRHGDLVVTGRQRFERRYAVADALPAAAREAVPREEAVVELVRRASVAYGVATLDDLADHPRVKSATARAAVAELVAAGELEPVEVEGWAEPAYLAPGARIPRRVEAAALLAPFDPLVWYRPRALRLFGFHYRISIYTPAAQREHGYYVLPVLVDDELVGRVDLKSDRQAGVLRVRHAHVEPDAAPRAVDLAERVAPLLHEAAAWQGLSDVQVDAVGTWAAPLAGAVG